MKKFSLTLLTCLLFLSPSVVLSETLDELVLREGIYYKKHSDISFSGEVTGRTQGLILKGEREGAWIGYHRNGQLSFKGNYKNGKYDGSWVSYNKNGTVVKKLTGTFKSDKMISD